MLGPTPHAEPVSAVVRSPELGRRLPHFVNRTLLGYAVVIIVAVWSFGLWHIWREYGESMARADAEMTTIAVGVAQHVEAMLHDGIGAARAAMNLIEARGGLAALTDAEVQATLTANLTGGDYVRALFIVADQRKIRAMRPGVEASIGQAPLAPPAVAAPPAGDIWVGNPAFGPGRPDDMVLPIAVLRTAGVATRVWAGALFGIGPIYRTYERLRFQDGVVAIVSDDHRILVRVPTPSNDVRITGQVLRIPEDVARKLDQRQLVQAPSQFTGAEMVYVHYAVSGYPLEVVIGRPQTVVFADWQSRALNTLGIMAVATALFILLTLFLRRSIDDLKDREAQYRMLFDDLERAHAALETLNVDLERRVQWRTRDLEQANAQLALANQELESFAASASHDLRSPLGSISGMAGLLEAELAEGRRDTAERRLGRIQDGVKRMAEVIDGLLNLARMTTQDGNVEPVDLSELAAAIAVELRQQYPEYQVAFECDAGLKVQADPRLMRTLLGNLMGNAWKYTGQKTDPRIEFRCVAHEHGASEYVLRDNGAGFDMRYAEKLFKPFRRLHSAEQFPGIGIGLATVARIVRRYGGQIWAEGRPDEGAAFHFTLPAADLPARSPQTPSADAA